MFAGSVGLHPRDPEKRRGREKEKVRSPAKPGVF